MAVSRSALLAHREDVAVDGRATQREWDGFVTAHPDATANHLWGWRHVYERAFGHPTEYLAARRAGEIVGVLPLVVFENRAFGRFAISLPFVNYGGVVASDTAAAARLLDAAGRLADQRALKHIELRHREPCFSQLPRKRHKAAMLLPLASDADEMWQRLDRKVRNQIRKAEKSGITVAVGGSQQLPDFYTVFARTMRDLGTPVYPRRFFEEVFAQFPERSLAVVISHGGRPIAAAVTFAHRDALEVPSAASLREFRPLCPGNLLYWTIIREAIARGFTTLDFGRSTPGEGTFLFKQQWGAEAQPLCWEYCLRPGHTLSDRSPDNPKFRAAIAAWKRLPLGIASTLGPRIVRFLP